jgi:hypothetical protein
MAAGSQKSKPPRSIHSADTGADQLKPARRGVPSKNAAKPDRGDAVSFLVARMCR